ncbi:MAG: DUF5995 family protein [Gemmatimonadota bacterium]|nr:DUF5995 family protein [Gemmatimonadota bacterium]
MTPRPVRTIDDVISDLDGVVRTCHERGSRAGYFPALYRRVTVEVRDWIREGRFDDGARMERLDVLFADRYLEAWQQRERGEPTSRSWGVAFDATEAWWPIVLQHLLLGINAHINLDLGIAAARTAPGADIHGLGDDFRRINNLLASMIDDVQKRLADVWPLLRLLDWLGGDADEATIHFSIERAREAAWALAVRLSALPEAAWAHEIQTTDRLVATLGRVVRHPGPGLGTVLRGVRLGELRSPEGVIELLS